MKKRMLAPAGLIFALGVSAGSMTHAADDDEMFQNSRPASAFKAKSRSYLGARDEGRLEVQASLPQPTRNADGTSTVMDEHDEPVTAPASD